MVGPLITLGLGAYDGTTSCSYTDASGNAIIDAYNAQRTSGHGVNVTYYRGGNSVALLVLPGRTDMEQEITPGILTTTDSRDFLILASELIISASVVLPQRRDYIDWNGNRLEVASPDGDRYYRYSDPFEKILRVHTKGG